jgi:hypothetical protein
MAGTIADNTPCRSLTWARLLVGHAFTKGWIGEPSAQSLWGKDRRPTNPQHDDRLQLTNAAPQQLPIAYYSPRKTQDFNSSALHLRAQPR